LAIINLIYCQTLIFLLILANNKQEKDNLATVEIRDLKQQKSRGTSPYLKKSL